MEKVKNMVLQKKVFFFVFLFASLSNAFNPLETFDRVMDWFDRLDWEWWDTTYVTPYREHWRISVNGFAYSNSTLLDAGIEDNDFGMATKGSFDSEASFKMNLGLDYRALGFSYTFDLDHKERNLTFGYNGDIFGVNMLLHRSRSLHGLIDADFELEMEGEMVSFDSTFSLSKNSSNKVVFLLESYFVLNNRKFSYPAGLTQKNRQKRSAGSFLLGFLYAKSRIYLYDDELKMLWMGMDKYDVQEYAPGIGYAHNFVFWEGENHHFLFMFSLMPYLIVYEKYRLVLAGEEIKDYGWTVSTDEDELSWVFSFKNSFTYCYKNIFAGIKFSYMSQELFKEPLGIINEMVTSNIYLGVRF